jgi:hypothetical protein
MGPSLDPNHQDLLFQLLEILRNPDLPAVFQYLSDWDKTQGNRTSPSPLSMDKPSLLQRMDVLNCSDDSKKLSNLTEEGTSLKRTRSPPSSKSSGTTLLSRLHSPKKRQHLTPISPKYSPSMLRTTSPDPPDWEFSISVSPATRAKIFPHMVTGTFPSLMGPTTKTKVKLIQKGGNSLNRMSHGTRVLPPLPLTLSTPVAKKPVGYSEYTTATSPKQNSTSKLLTTHLPEFPLHNGSESSKETQSTSTRSSPPCTLMRKERVAWETRRSLLASLNQKSVF